MSFFIFLIRFGLFLFLVTVSNDPVLATIIVSLVFYKKLGVRKELFVYLAFLLFILTMT